MATEDLIEFLKRKFPPEHVIKSTDATLIKPVVSMDEVLKLVDSVHQYGFYCALLQPSVIDEIVDVAKVKNVKLCSVAGFPYGYQPIKAKLLELEALAQSDLSEVDVVINLTNLLNGKYDLVNEELKLIGRLSKDYSLLIKIIVEAPVLTDKMLRKVIELMYKNELYFIKTSTGIISKGGDLYTVLRVHKIAREYGMKVKAAGGIRRWIDAALALLAGASRIGSSSYMNLVKVDDL